MTNPKMTKTLRGQRSRQAILEATGQLIAIHGGNHVTLDQIADACNIAKSSILWHFSSKDDLLLEVVDTTYHHFAEAIISKYTPGSTTLEKVTYLLNGYTSVSLYQPEIPTIFFSFAFGSKKQKKIRDKIEEIYDWNRKAYKQHFGISENLAAILLGMVNGILIQWLIAPDRINIEVHLQEMIPVFNTLIENEKTVQRRST